MELINNEVQKLRKKTPKNHKIIGRIVTGLSVASLFIAESGIVDSKPMIKIGLQALSVALGGQAVYHGRKTIEDEN